MKKGRLAAGVLAALAGVVGLPGAAHANGRFPSAEQLVVDPGDPNHIAVQVTYGFIHTLDAGGTWTWTCEDAAQYGGELDPPIALLDGGVMIAGVFDGLVVASPDGCSLGFVPGLEKKFVVDVSASKVDPRRAIAISSNGLGMNKFDTRVWASSDAGANWAQQGTSLPDDFLALTADLAPSNEQRVYVSGFVIASSTNYVGSLARSSDGGQTWEIVPIPGSANNSGPYLAAVDPSNPDRIYLRLDGELGTLLVSDDAGDTWETVYTASGRLLGFALSPDGSQVRVGSETDGIHAASTTDLAFSQINTLGTRCLTWHKGVLYACAKEAVAGYTIGKSVDGGQTFEAIHHLQCLEGPDPKCAADTDVAQKCISKWAAQQQILQTNTCDTANQGGGGGAGGGGSGDESDGCGCRAAGDDSGDDIAVYILLAAGIAIAQRHRARRASGASRTSSQITR
ncbi:MAG: hypothetical protein HOV80_10915 [Polyangiaceae bacterium]|nr:hypothetical protein [Polyangiaceae bacterium]